MVAGAARIRVTFSVDADGLLSVEAQEETTGIKAGVEVKPSYGLTDGEIADMLKESQSHAKDDLEARRLREEQVEAQRVIESLRSALEADGEQLLSSEERQAVVEQLNSLIEIAAAGSHVEIRRAIEALEKKCEFYVERRMNASVRKAMSGHQLSEFE
jgi:molecular chaperone HscA